MDSLVTAAYVQAPFSYTQAPEIQTATEPNALNRNAVHHLQTQQQQQQGLVGAPHVLPVQVGAPQMIQRPMQVAQTVNPYDTIEAMIQREQQAHQAHHPHSQLTHPHTAPHNPHNHTQPQQAAQQPHHSMRLSSTSSDTVVKIEKPRVKGRMTPYAFFVQERRDKYRQQGVPVQFTAFSKECSQIWKTMDDEDKIKFQELAEEDRERYRKEVAGSDKPLAKDGTRRGRRKKEPGQPKRNMCAFLHFCVVKRPKLKQENPSLSVGAMAKQLSSAWKLMTPDQKKPYNDMADRDKQRYEQQKQAYDAGYSAGYLHQDLSPNSMGEAGGSGAAVNTPPPLLSPRHRRRKKNPDMPRRNMSAFMFFSLEQRPNVKKSHPDFGVGQLSKQLAGNWKQFNSDDKKPYEHMAQKDKERYETELKSFKKGLYTGSTLSARDIVMSVTGKAVPPPSQSRTSARDISHDLSREISHDISHDLSRENHLEIDLGLDESGGLNDHGVSVTQSDNEETPHSEDELDQLCEYYQ